MHARCVGWDLGEAGEYGIVFEKRRKGLDVREDDFWWHLTGYGRRDENAML